MKACFPPAAKDVLFYEGLNKRRLKEVIEITLVKVNNTTMFYNLLIKVLGVLNY